MVRVAGAGGATARLVRRALIAGQVTDGSVVKVDARGGQLAVEIENPVAKETEVAVGA